MTAPSILVLNLGSSSLKFAVYGADDALPLRLSGQVAPLAGAPKMRARAGDRIVADEVWPDAQGLEPLLQRIFDWLAGQGWAADIEAVGHRIVHGGLQFSEPTILTPDVMTQLGRLAALAPLHQPFNLRGAEAARIRFPTALQVGLFDTAFHSGQPRIARLYALPRYLIDEGVVAYGFHGLSYEYIAGKLRTLEGPAAGGRSIVLHLGSGVSLCALRDGHSVATTMGFSALEGPPMSTRSGSIDPGVLLHLMQGRGMSAEAVSDLLYNRSGLLGLSGLSGDMVTLLASREATAREALDVYVYRLAREIGSLTACLGGLDTLVFTAGVGENAAPIRERVAELCAWLGVRLDPAANLAAQDLISTSDSGVKVRVIPTDEAQVIACGAASALAASRR